MATLTRAMSRRKTFEAVFEDVHVGLRANGRRRKPIHRSIRRPISRLATVYQVGSGSACTLLRRFCNDPCCNIV